MKSDNGNLGQKSLTDLNKAAWDIDKISQPNARNNYKVRSGSGNVSTGLGRLAMFKKLAEEAARKDGDFENSPQTSALKSASYFARGKLMKSEEKSLANDSKEANKNVAADPLPKISSLESATLISTSQTLPQDNQEDSVNTTMTKGMNALISALSNNKEAENYPPAKPRTGIKRSADVTESKSPSPPRKRSNCDVKPKVPNNPYEMPEYGFNNKDQADEEGSSGLCNKSSSDVQSAVSNDPYEMPEHSDNKKGQAGKKGGSGFRKRQATVDKPNFQRINMRKKCFTRFGASQMNRKKKLLKFRKRANRAAARREMREEAEWGLDTEGVQDEAGTTKDSERKQNLKIDVPAGPLAIAANSSHASDDSDAFKKRLFSSLELSDELQDAAEKLFSGQAAYQQLLLSEEDCGCEGWFHRSLDWQRLLAATVELHRHCGLMGDSGQGSAIGIVVLCDPTCPLPLPAFTKSRKKSSKKSNSQYNTGGAVITGDMSPDERQEVVMKARCSEISYIVCRPEMLLSSDWFRRSGLPPVACVCLLFAERIVPAPWLANVANIFTCGKNNSSNVRAEFGCLVARIFSIFNVGIEDTSENEPQSVRMPILVASPFSPATFDSFDFGVEFAAKCGRQRNSNLRLRVFSVNKHNKLAACSTVLQRLLEKQQGSCFSSIIYICDCLTTSMRLEQLFRQDGNIAIHFQYLSGKGGTGSSNNGIELTRMASQDDIVQAALQKTKSATADKSAFNVIVTTIEALPHVFAYNSLVPPTVSIFVGLPPSRQHFTMVDMFSCDGETNSSEIHAIVDSVPAIETNSSLRSSFTLSSSLFLLKQIIETLLAPSGDKSCYWNSVDVSTLSRQLDCHPCLIVAILTELYNRRFVIDIAGSRQDSCLIRLYGSDEASVSLFEENPMLAAARRIQTNENDDTTLKSKQRSFAFSLCQLANEMDEMHPDQIRRHLFQLRPATNYNSQQKAFSQRSPLVITFAPQWSLMYKVFKRQSTDYDSLTMSIVNYFQKSDKTVQHDKVAMANLLCPMAVPVSSAKWGQCNCFTTEEFGDLKTGEIKEATPAELKAAKRAIEDLIDSWSSSEAGSRPTPWAIARNLHGIMLPGFGGSGRKERAEWLPTMRVSSRDVSNAPYLHIGFMELVDLARQVLIS